MLTTRDRRRWIFRGARLRNGLTPGSGVPGGAALGSVVRAGNAPGVRIELWQSARGGYRLENLWNPLLFLGVRTETTGPVVRYPGDKAAPEAIAHWMGAGTARAGLPPSLPVMAALVDSNLRNVPYGDRDSVGFFAMRLSIWNFGPYKGFARHPELQLKWFIDHALTVRAQRLAEGDPDPIPKPKAWGLWAADVIRPAEMYRGRYQLRLDEARRLLARGGPLPPQAPAPVPAAAPEPVPAAPVPPHAAPALAAPVPAAPVLCRSCARARQQAVRAALSALGTPYRWGGNSPSTGFDSSGLVQWAYGRAGVQLPRVSSDDANVGKPVRRDDLGPGDLVLFEDSTGYVHHVGIYVGEGRFVHAPHTGDVVKLSSLDEPYYARQFAGGRRIG
jgi:cell wall-associated NlpC family hydrolase